MAYSRIFILGNSATGKTTLARKLSAVLRIKHYDLDDLFWKRKYTERRSKAELLRKVKAIAKKKQWIIEGVYSTCAECILPKTELVIWLDYPFHVTAKRLLSRQIGRESFKQNLTFLRYVWNYRKAPPSPHYFKNEANYHKHKSLLERSRTNYVHIRTSSALDKFLKENFGIVLEK